MNSTVEFVRSSFRIFMAAARHFNQSDGWAMSSHVALSLMIAIFPFLIFAASLAGFLGYETRTGDIVELVFEYWPEEIAAPIVREINIVFTRGNLGFLTIGIGLALFFASNGVEAVRVALNRAYRDQDDRSILAQRLQSIMFILVAAMLILMGASDVIKKSEASPSGEQDGISSEPKEESPTSEKSDSPDSTPSS